MMIADFLRNIIAWVFCTILVLGGVAIGYFIGHTHAYLKYKFRFNLLPFDPIYSIDEEAEEREKVLPRPIPTPKPKPIGDTE